MKIITWNINRFNGTSASKIWIEARKCYLKEVFEHIKLHIKEKDDIILLQEFPYQWELPEAIKGKYKILSWYDVEGEKKFINTESGRTEKNRNSGPISLTIAIVTAESHWNLKKFDDAINFGKFGEKFNYVNKYVQLRNEKSEIELLGIHMPARDMQAKDPRQGIEELINAFDNKGKDYVPHIIVGDFNAGDYEKDKESQDFKENREKYRKLIKTYKYKDVIKNTTTNYAKPTEIDHVLITKTFLKEYECESTVQYEKELSDHYPIVVKLKKKH